MAVPFDLDLLRTFVAVVECGGFSHAAPRIGRSQSALSMQMQRLEQAVGKELLVRGPRSVVASPAGEPFLTYARRLLRLADEAYASVTRPEETGAVRLGVPDDYAAYLLPPVLARFGAAHPLMNVHLVCEPSYILVRAVEAGELDIALVSRLPDQPFEVLRRERLVWVGAPEHAAWERDPLPIALFETGCATRLQVLRALGEVERAFRPAYSSASLFGVTAVVRAGLAVAALAECSVPPSLCIIGEAEGLPPLRDLDLSLLRHAHTKTVAADRLHDFLRRDLARP
ncbi:MAG TPA: LysR substrate-binding domain-containing protein [Xanthobacteraceae bacterium]|nr:LysR substrate-binding domain-containing protein [Xanthobacteraceae bacterium]